MSCYNAESRNVSWRLCKPLWDEVLTVGHGSDGQHRKQAGSWRERVGQGQYIFSFDAAPKWAKNIPRGKSNNWDFEQTAGTELICERQFSTQLCSMWTQTVWAIAWSSYLSVSGEAPQWSCFISFYLPSAGCNLTWLTLCCQANPEERLCAECGQTCD